MELGRRYAWGCTIGGAVLFCAAMVPMARRIAAFNSAANIPTFHAEAIAGRTMHVQGYPDATLTDVPPESGEPLRGEGAIRLDYAGRQTLIPVKRPPALDLPNLSGYDEWLKPLAIYPVKRNTKGEQYHEPDSERFIIVVRRTPEGLDPESWGEVRRIDWVFDFYELKRDGSVEHTLRRWPRSYKSEARLKREAAGQSANLTPEQAKFSQKLVAIEPLKQRTFEYYAAMFVIPKLNVPEYKFTDTAFSPDVLGWTLPGSMIAVLLFTGGLIFAVAPRRRKTPARATDQ